MQQRRLTLLAAILAIRCAVLALRGAILLRLTVLRLSVRLAILLGLALREREGAMRVSGGSEGLGAPADGGGRLSEARSPPYLLLLTAHVYRLSIRKELAG